MVKFQHRSLTLRGIHLSPPSFLAPMAGVTHSAFRRLVSDFGGYGALYTEMLSSRALQGEDLRSSPFTKRRAEEGNVVYQIRFLRQDSAARTVERLKTIEPLGIDVNLGCPAPEIKRFGGGAALFNDMENLGRILGEVRNCWDGIFTVKCRLGAQVQGWEEPFFERLRLFERSGVDAVAVHPRFEGDKLKRTALWKVFSSITSQIKLPVIANGDICRSCDSPELLDKSGCAALMIGRMAAVKPWIFREFTGNTPAVDYLEIWQRLFEYVREDFPPEKAIGRIKEFTAYFSRNFFFGHELFRKVQSSGDLDTLRTEAVRFLSNNPKTVQEPSVAGI